MAYMNPAFSSFGAIGRRIRPFDPEAGVMGGEQLNPGAVRSNRVNRLQQLEGLFKQFPGSAAGGTGATGYKNLEDYSQGMQNQQDYITLQNQVYGSKYGARPLEVEYDPGDKSSPQQRMNQLRQMDASRGLRAWSLG